MSAVPWWYLIVHEWRWRAFIETHHWPDDIAMTIGPGSPPVSS